MAEQKPAKKAARKKAAPPGANEGGIRAMAAQAAQQAESLKQQSQPQAGGPTSETVAAPEQSEVPAQATGPVSEQEPQKAQESTEQGEHRQEYVGEIVGETLPTDVGRENPTNSQPGATSIFGGDRKAKIRGRKLHPRDESDQKNVTMRQFLLNAVVDLADQEGLSTQPGKVFDALVEHALRQLAPDILKDAYEDRCQAIGISSDWK